MHSHLFQMTSSLANNDAFDVDSLYGGPYSWFNQEGLPINKQIPRGDQVIAIIAGQTINDPFDGSPNVLINADMAGAGNANLTLTLQGARNVQGKTLTIAAAPTGDGGVRFLFINLPAGFVFAYTGSVVPLALTHLRFPTGSASCIKLVFMRDNATVQVQGDVTGYTFS